MDEINRNYQELAVKIVEVACADYIDALIIRQQGYISEKQLIKRIYKTVLKYGKRRYVWKDKHGEMHHQTQSRNKFMCKTIADLLDNKTRVSRAEYEIHSIEEFFHSPTFDLFMPNTDADGLIRLLKRRAMKHNRMNTGYPSLY